MKTETERLMMDGSWMTDAQIAARAREVQSHLEAAARAGKVVGWEPEEPPSDTAARIVRRWID